MFNLIFEKEGCFYYSIVRADGFNVQEWAKRRAEKLHGTALNAEKKSEQYYNASNEGRAFLQLGEPIKVGHHSEKRHRALIERNQNRMRKAIEFDDKADDYERRAEYWDARAETINLSMPESIEFYEYRVDVLKLRHDGLKNGKIERSHGLALTYAKKELNDAEKKLSLSKKLWA